MSEQRFAGFQSDLQQLIGQQCWGSVCGPGTGSGLSFELGRRRERVRPARNPTLSDEIREHEGEAGFFIQCAWRVEASGELIGGSGDTNDLGGPMVRAAKKLEGEIVSDVQVVPPYADLVLTLKGGNLVLRVFPDSSFVENDHQYSVRVSQGHYAVGGIDGLSLEVPE